MPESENAVESWREQAGRAGRQLTDVSIPGWPPVTTLGWLEGSEPAAGGETGVDRAKPPQVLLLTFAAALRACWTDRSAHPFPGVPTDEETVLNAVAALGPVSTAAVNGGEGSQRHRKGAIRKLGESLHLAIQGSTIRLGSAVATWSETQVTALRAVYDQLPTAAHNDSGRPM